MENPIFQISQDEKGIGVSNGNSARKKLADISNLPQQLKSPIPGEKQQKVMTIEYVDRLQKENTALVKMVAERNKIIELSRLELQKLQVNLQKYQQQNLQLAKANSQMLAELNSGKDRLKLLQHELGCKNGLLQAKELVVEERGNEETCIKHEERTTQDSNVAGSLQADRDNSKPHTTNRKRQSCPDKQDQPKEKVDKKRSCSRRQSARFKSKEPNPSEDAFEIDNSTFLVSPFRDDGVPEKYAASSTSSVSTDDRTGNAASQQEEPQRRRSSVGRPLRQAAQKILSYKEKSLNVKMRRET